MYFLYGAMHLTPPLPIYCGFIKSKWSVENCMNSMVGWGIASYYLTPTVMRDVVNL